MIKGLLLAFVLLLAVYVPVQGHEAITKDDLAGRLAKRFNLNELEVREFLSQFYLGEFEEVNVVRYAPRSVTTTRTVTKTVTSSPVAVQQTAAASARVTVSEGDKGMYTRHIEFVDDKLEEGVRDNWFTDRQREMIVAKLREKMDAGPSSHEYRGMSDEELQSRINTWKREMRRWSSENGFTLDRIRNVTGKGNKYLMGIEF